MRCRDCHHFLCCARVLKSLFVFSEFGFSWRRPRASSADLAPAPTLSSFCPSKQKDASHEFGTDWTWEIRAKSNLCTSQRKSASDMQLASGRVLSPQPGPALLPGFWMFFFGGVPSPDKEEWDHVIVRETEFFGSWRTCLRVSGAFLLQELEALCGRFGFGRLVPLHNVSAM